MSGVDKFRNRAMMIGNPDSIMTHDPTPFGRALPSFEISREEDMIIDLCFGLLTSIERERARTKIALDLRLIQLYEHIRDQVERYRFSSVVLFKDHYAQALHQLHQKYLSALASDTEDSEVSHRISGLLSTVLKADVHVWVFPLAPEAGPRRRLLHPGYDMLIELWFDECDEEQCMVLNEMMLQDTRFKFYFDGIETLQGFLRARDAEEFKLKLTASVDFALRLDAITQADEAE